MDKLPFILFISFFIAQRLSELWIARKNEKWLRANGAIEYGQKHYPFIILLHSSFIGSLIGAYFLKQTSIDFVVLIFYIFLLIAKIWVISSLGNYWNTKILRIPGMSPIRKGPYKYFKHPNYVIVVCEFIIVPLVFHLYCTAIIFSLLNAFMLRVRIRAEERVWELQS
jgi:methyltransferase